MWGILRVVVDIVVPWDTRRRKGDFYWWGLVRCWVDRGVCRLWGHLRGELRMVAWKGRHPLSGKARRWDERLGHAHGHGDDVSQGKQRLCVGGPHVGMLLRYLRGHGDILTAARA